MNSEHQGQILVQLYLQSSKLKSFTLLIEEVWRGFKTTGICSPPAAAFRRESSMLTGGKPQR